MPSGSSIAMTALGVVGTALTMAGPIVAWAGGVDSASGPSPASSVPAPHPAPAPQTWTVSPEDPTTVAPADPAAVPSPTATPATTPTSGRTAAGPAAAADAVPARAKVAYLTFDDGPDPTYTPQVLRILEAYGAKATFFMIGQEAARNPRLVQAVRAGGHAVGNHSYTHPAVATLPEAALRSEVARTNHVLGDEVTCFRPPGGAEGGSVKPVAQRLEMAISLWTVDTGDWKRPGPKAIVASALTPPDGGGAEPLEILMHDGGGDRSQTVAALPTVLQRLSDAGYTFEPLPSCAPTR